MSRRARLVLWFLGSRALALVAMVAGSYRPRPHDELHWVGNDGTFFWDQLPIRALDVWGRWDTAFYWHIARFGYPALAQDGNWVFHAAYFPLFPSMMRGLSVLLGGAETYLCGLVLANALLVLALVYLDKLVRLDSSERFAELVIAALMAYPGTHFLSCVYPESTALFLAVFAIYCARTGKPVVAGLACMLACITRSSGIILCVPVLYELLRAPEGRLRWHPRALVVLFPLLTLAFWLGLNWQLYGDPIYFVHVQAAWGRKPTFFLEPLFDTKLSLDHHLFALAAIVGVGYAIWRRQRPGYIALAGINALLPLSTGMLRGIHRYMASNFPLFIFLAQWLEGRRWWRLAYFVIGLSVMGVFAFKWGQGYWPN